ncbi:MAG: hypothetical protein KDE47_27065, partial [Caldilineaceae bacterium]|nr:hypothetical protein [Caldilineaceae bacterium]
MTNQSISEVTHRSRGSWLPFLRKKRHWLVATLLLLVLGNQIGAVALYHAGCAAFSNYTGFDLLLMTLSALGFALLGTLLSVHHPQNRIGWFAHWQAVGCGIAALGFLYFPCAAAGHVALPPLVGAAWVFYAFGEFFVIVPMFVLIPATFPDGRFLSRRWSAMIVGGLAIQFLLRGAMGLLPDLQRNNAYGFAVDLINPAGLAWLPNWWYPLFRNSSLLMLCILSLLAVASMATRFRRAAADERQQIKWFTYFLVTAVSIQLIVFEVLGSFVYPPIFQSVWYQLILLIVFAGYPAVIGIAILCYRLYDINLLINRTLLYGVLSLLISVTYLGTVGGLRLLMTGQPVELTGLLLTLPLALGFFYP